jgi:hypothetical protein
VPSPSGRLGLGGSPSAAATRSSALLGAGNSGECYPVPWRSTTATERPPHPQALGMSIGRRTSNLQHEHGQPRPSTKIPSPSLLSSLPASVQSTLATGGGPPPDQLIIVLRGALHRAFLLSAICTCSHGLHLQVLVHTCHTAPRPSRPRTFGLLPHCCFFLPS